MAWMFLLLGAVAVVAIALVAVGRVVSELEALPPPAVYEMEGAVDWIAARLPDEVTARLSYDDVALIAGWHLDWFGEVGVASKHGEQLAGADVTREGAVAAQDAAVDAVVARSLAERGPNGALPIDAVDVVCVLDLQMQYLTEIGAIGSRVTP